MTKRKISDSNILKFADAAASAGDLLATAICEKAVHGEYRSSIDLSEKEKKQVDDMSQEDCLGEAWSFIED